MEIFLLLLDELDDAAASLRMLWPQLLGFALACGLFSLSILAVMQWPNVAAVILLVAMVLTTVSALRLRPVLRFKTDP